MSVSVKSEILRRTRSRSAGRSGRAEAGQHDPSAQCACHRLGREQPGNVPNAQDWKVSCGPKDFPTFVRNIREVEAAMGRGARHRVSAKSLPSAGRKSLVAAKDFAAKRPGDGINPDQLEALVGRVLLTDVAEGEAIVWGNLQ